MATFTITTTATETLKASSTGHAEAVFTVTNSSTRPVRGLARVKALGETKQDWLAIAGEGDRDFAAGATEQFKVNFDATGGSSGKYSFRLDVAAATNPDEDSTQGPTVTVEAAAPPPPPPPNGGFPKWIIFVIIGVVLLIGVIILIVVLKSRGSDEVAVTPTPTPVETPTATEAPTAMPTATLVPSPVVDPAIAEKRCYDLVQGHIAWDYNGSTGWSPINVQNLCRGTSNPSEPARCFDRVLHGGIDSGGGDTFTVEKNTDRPGRDYTSFDLPQAVYESCRDACAKDPKCTAYTYVNPGVQSKSARCWLKSGSPPPAGSGNCCISGVKRSGRGIQWEWQNAINLCAGTNDADRTIGCFQSYIAKGGALPQAIDACKSR